mmetsp:Transcript_7658/g.11506  ORF Transcript_7658/g.11506 Transcript_7658/m.11506 type:complete len:269 (+) Transcript_7658:971-1777(+)
MMQMGGQARKSGLGSVAAKQAQCGVYISGLPPTIKLKEVEAIFSAHGPVRRTKIYTEGGDEYGLGGTPKGDALVTFVRSSSVETCVALLNNYEVAPGYSISVSRADFSHKEKSDLDKMIESAFSLPSQCMESEFPVVVLHNVYTPEQVQVETGDFFADLEGDMLQECIKFGTVKCVVTLEGQYEGSVAITFSDSQGAQKCAKAMHGRWFDKRQIEVELKGKMIGGAPTHLNQINLDSGIMEDVKEQKGKEPEKDENIPDDLEAFLSSV